MQVFLYSNCAFALMMQQQHFSGKGAEDANMEVLLLYSTALKLRAKFILYASLLI
jgi:hypothetical protein